MLSVAVQFARDWPIPRTRGLANDANGKHETLAIPLPSEADAAGAYDVIITVGVSPLLGETLALLGQTIDGGMISATMTGNTSQETPLPARSTAEQKTYVAPSEKDIPDDTLHDAFITPELSTAEKLQVPTTVGVIPFAGERLSGVPKE